MKRVALILCGVCLLAAVAAGGASAFTRPAGVSIAGCIFANGGQATVAAGTDVVLFVGDVTRRRGQAEAAMHNWSFALANVDGTPIFNPDSYWNTPIPDTNVVHNGVTYPDVWVTWWIYDTGVTLAAGETLTLDFNLVALHPGTDGFSRVDPLGPWPRQIVGGLCTITAA